MMELRLLFIDGTQVTEAGASKLGKVLSSARIAR
jgi:hypothetical protein